VPGSATIGKDKTGRAVCLFSQSERGKEIMQDVADGIRSTTSFRYIVREMILESSKDGVDTYRVTKWEALEVSLENIPADLAVGVGRSIENELLRTLDPQAKRAALAQLAEREGFKLILSADVRTNPESPAAPTAPATNSPTQERGPAPMPAPIENNETPTPNPDLARAAEIIALGDLVGQREFAVDLSLETGMTLETARTRIAAKRKESQTATPTQTAEELATNRGETRVEFPLVSRPRYFKGATTQDAARKAYRFGQWLLAGPLGNAKAREYCKANGISLEFERAQQESINEKGGFLVPTEFGTDMIDLKEEFGVMRRVAEIVPMASDSRTDPRRTGGLTARFVGESVAGTVDDLAWEQVELNAKKLICMARISSELNEDSLINTADKNFGEISYAFSVKEDDSGFNGDGTSTYGGITGVRTKLKNLSGTIANIAGLVVSTGTGYATSYNAIVLKDFHKVKGRLPAYALRRGPRWFMHQSFWSEVVEALVMAVGGVTAAEIAAGAAPKLLGYPVEISQSFPSVSAVSQVAALFGCMDLAVSLGDRRKTTLALSEHSRFANDELELKGTERFDINAHDVGNADATAANRVPGPIVGMITAAS
jgi:HK97 family phage major capsid protein